MPPCTTCSCSTVRAKPSLAISADCPSDSASAPAKVACDHIHASICCHLREVEDSAPRSWHDAIEEVGLRALLKGLRGRTGWLKMKVAEG